MLLNWLHLTDLHWNQKGHSTLWPELREIFLSDISYIHSEAGPFHLVFFTGDIVQNGSANQFDEVQLFLDELWSKLSKLGSSPLLLAVPGNHDLSRPKPCAVTQVLTSLLARTPFLQQAFWLEQNGEYRQCIEKCFEAYQKWWRESPQRPHDVVEGVLPGDFSFTLSHHGWNIGVLGLNTSFLQLNDSSSQGTLFIGVEQFHGACQHFTDGPSWAKSHDLCFLLTHHPTTWLNTQAQEHYSALINVPGRFALHLFGHMHESDCSAVSQGGAEPRRKLQGPSLFGLEHFGSERAVSRSHGYSAGRLEVTDHKSELTLWPRRARKVTAGHWEIGSDQNFSLIGNHTRPIHVAIDRLSSVSKPALTQLELTVEDLHRLSDPEKIAIISTLTWEPIDTRFITPQLIASFSRHVSDDFAATAVIAAANALRARADPTCLPHELNITCPVSLSAAGATVYWTNVFSQACARSGRMLGSLILATPFALLATQSNTLCSLLRRCRE